MGRFRQLLPLLDRQLPQDVSPVLAERFQGFSQHMLYLAVEWRDMVVKNFAKIEFLTEVNVQFAEDEKYDLTRNGNEFRSLLVCGLDTVDSCLVSARQRLGEYEDMEDLKTAVEKCEVLKKKMETRMSDLPSLFVESARKAEVSGRSAISMEIIKTLECCKAVKKFHPVGDNFGDMSFRMKTFHQKMDSWVMGKPATRKVMDDGSFQKMLDRLVVRCLMGIQEGLKKSQEFLVEEMSWMESMKTLVGMSSSLKTGQVKICFEKVVSVLGLVAGLGDSSKMFEATKDVASVVIKHLDLAKSVQNMLVLSLLQFNKFLSVLLKVFNEIAVNGFCPVKEVDEDGSKTSDEFKSSEEETGLGQGEGKTDVSDQIDNEDMLDGAYKNQEDADEKDDDENDLDDESGEVEGNEDLDKDMWGDEDEDDKNQELDESEEKGKTEEDEDDNLSAKDDQKEKADQEKRQRKEEEKEEETPEFDDNQTDPYHGEDKQIPEPEAFDLPESMELDDKEQEDNFEEGGENEPESMPDFEEDQTSPDDENDDE